VLRSISLGVIRSLQPEEVDDKITICDIFFLSTMTVDDSCNLLNQKEDKHNDDDEVKFHGDICE